ncbi:Chromosome (plasmid) partitioning protein ParB (plasmid) [Acidisarcina polymorpha]|uniref:Chromosome (Plasmid) partitioning protein ParB n=1 Tax=Acidisarcina polymorpha TaxID=2211140 RepID=A0A2Z5GAK3_9BACT|nr:hypothetical protein [Acidisarcina polymorpha]AXC15950.1 Chromosome (plasmid) partitioning protein ParB [Acidisarcina polymorpha]
MIENAPAIIGDDENNQQSAEEVLASTLAKLPDDKLTGFALRLGFTAHTALPRQGETDFLAAAAAAFAPPQPQKASKPKKAQTPRAKATPKKSAPKKKVAA